MKQNKLRILSLFLIFALCLGLLSACGGGENTPSNSGSTNPAEASPEPLGNEGKEMAYYAKTILEEKNPLGIVGKVCPADGGIYAEGQTMNYADGTRKSSLYFIDTNGEIKSLNSDWLGESNISEMCAAEGGGLWLVKSRYISHDNVEYELGSFVNGEYSKLLELDMPAGILLSGLCTAKGRIFIAKTNPLGKNVVEAYKPDGEKAFELNVGGTDFDLVSDGTFLYIGKLDVSGSLNISSLNPENGNITEIASLERGRLLACSGEKIYLGDSTELTEYDIASKSSRSLFLWGTCGLRGNLSSIWSDGKNGFIVKEGYVIKSIYQDVKRERTQVIFAVNSNPQWFSQSVFKFNEENPIYEVIIKDYGAYPDPQQALNTDMISGKTPDLIDAAGFSDEMIKRGTMKDLMKYIEADSDFGIDDFLEGPLNAMKTKDGELLAIAPSFYVSTIFCRNDMAQSREYEGVINELNKLGTPEEAFAGTLSQDFFLRLAFCCGDADKYSHEEIAAIIEYANELPPEDNHIKEHENLRNGKQRVLFATVSSSTFPINAAIQYYALKGTEDIALFGLPFREGTGVLIPMTYFAIPANATNPDGAWAFFKSYIVPDKNAERAVMNEYPLLKNIYEISKKESEKFIRGYYEQERATIGYEITDEDIIYCNKLSDAILDGLSGVFDDDAKVYEIVTDACGAYFAGQKLLDATADEIVSRLGIYFSEQS